MEKSIDISHKTIEELLDLSGNEIYNLWSKAGHPLFSLLGPDYCGCVSMVAHNPRHFSLIGDALDLRIREDKDNILPADYTMIKVWNQMTRAQRRAALERFEYWQKEYQCSRT